MRQLVVLAVQGVEEAWRMRFAKPCTSISEPGRRGVSVNMYCAADRARKIRESSE